MNNCQFIDQIFVEVGKLADLTGMDKAIKIVSIGQMLITLQNGIKKDEANNHETIESLQKQLDDLAEQINHEPPERINFSFPPPDSQSPTEGGD